MVEGKILEAIEQELKALKVNSNNPKSASLFKKVIANNAPIWTAVEVTPSACFYLSDTSYEDYDGLRYRGLSQVKIYIYDKHKARGLSLADVLSPYIEAVRGVIQNLYNVEPSILSSFVSKVSRDGGTVLPYTIAELVVDIDFTQVKTC